MKNRRTVNIVQQLLYKIREGKERELDRGENEERDKKIGWSRWDDRKGERSWAKKGRRFREMGWVIKPKTATREDEKLGKNGELMSGAFRFAVLEKRSHLRPPSGKVVRQDEGEIGCTLHFQRLFVTHLRLWSQWTSLSFYALVVEINKPSTVEKILRIDSKSRRYLSK